jgi:hypothetical protein
MSPGADRELRAESPSTLIDEIEQRWHDLWPVLVSLEGEEPQGRWSVKDVYVHLGRWDLVTALAVSAHVERRPTDDWDALFANYEKTNLRWVRQDTGIELAEARDRARAGHGRLMLTLRGLNNEDWDDYVRDMALDVRDHYQAHLDAPLEFAAT